MSGCDDIPMVVDVFMTGLVGIGVLCVPYLFWLLWRVIRDV